MSKYSSPDAYSDPETGVLKNRLGITDEAILETTEAKLVAIRTYELAKNPLAGNFDLAHLQAIHKRLFGDVYEWAGEIRDRDISKGTTRFANATYIESSAKALFQKLAAENHLAGLSAAAFSERAALLSGGAKRTPSFP